MKITKRQYEAKVARMNALKVQLEDVRDNMIAALEAGCNMGDAINNVHDAISDMENAMHDAETEYRRRNWTHADYASYSLVAQNID